MPCHSLLADEEIHVHSHKPRLLHYITQLQEQPVGLSHDSAHHQRHSGSAECLKAWTAYQQQLKITLKSLVIYLVIQLKGGTHFRDTSEI